MLHIEIKTIPDKDQRYDTVGDYYSKDGKDQVIISDMGNRQYEFFVAVHEMVEQFLCNNKGITDEQITQFDVAYEAGRRPGDDSEPGESADAPYHTAHMFAEKIEKMLVEECGFDWQEYSDYTNAFYKNRII